MGTPRYMSPEQARGEKVDARTDIFSLGVMLYEMLAGHAPFAGATPSEVIAAILRDEALPLPADAPPELQRLLYRSLQKQRDKRYQTAHELLTDLKRLQRQLERLDEQHDELPPETEKVAARASVESALIEVAQSAETESVPLSTPKPTPRRLFIQNKRTQLLLALFALLVIAASAGWFYMKRQPAVTEKDTILLADFDNKTGDALFDGTLKQGLATQLQQAYALNIFPDVRVRQVLAQMERPTDARLTAEMAREMCERQHLKAFLIGSIAQLGSRYVLTLEALRGGSGESNCEPPRAMKPLPNSGRSICADRPT